MNSRWNVATSDPYDPNSIQNGGGLDDGEPMVPVYRYYSTSARDHLLSLSATTPTGYSPEGLSFYVYRDYKDGRSLLTRCRYNGVPGREYHYVVNGGICGATDTNEGNYGYVANQAAAGLVILQRIYGAGTLDDGKPFLDHLSTPRPSEVTAAVGTGYFVLELTHGYVVPGP